jgi:hypothetical protein
VGCPSSHFTSPPVQRPASAQALTPCARGGTVCSDNHAEAGARRAGAARDDEAPFRLALCVLHPLVRKPV